MVDVEFSIEAKEDTMAAAKAANAIPFKPVGKNCNSHGYALSAWFNPGRFCKPASPKLAKILGSLTIT